MKTFPHCLVLCCLSSAAAAQTVFSSDFDGAMPPAIQPGTAALEGVQGYLGLGPAGNLFGGTFLRSATGNVVTLTLTGLPAHQELQLDFLFAAIDSLDGAGTYPSGDYFKVTLDGTTIFRESFANALPSQIQTYVPPPGVELARRVDLGFSGPGSYYTDSAYHLGGDPIFASLAHTAATATIEFVMEGPGIQGLGDESWAIDNLRVFATSGIQGSAAAYGTSCGPALQATATPRIGQAIALSLSNLPAATVATYGAFGLSSASIGAFVLPFPLASYGMPGCWLVQDASLHSALPFVLAGGSAAAAIPVPNDPGFVGLLLYAQGWAVVPGANPTMLLFSNGLRIRVGV